MDLTDLKNIKFLLENHDTKPIKHLGQNFLINKIVLEKISSYAKDGDVIIEVGPGLGTLTKELAKKAEKVIAIEKDQKMVDILQETLKEIKNVEIVHKDVLEINEQHFYEQLPTVKYKLIANLPYYISTAVIRKFLELRNPPEELILTVQKEVAERICSFPPNMNLLAVAIQFYAETKILFKIPRNYFWPQPGVDSAVLKINPRKTSSSFLSEKTGGLKFRNQFFRIARAGFSRPRAQLLNNLSNQLKLDKIRVKNWLMKGRVDPTQRAETLSMENWLKLAESLNKY